MLHDTTMKHTLTETHIQLGNMLQEGRGNSQVITQYQNMAVHFVNALIHQTC